MMMCDAKKKDAETKRDNDTNASDGPIRVFKELVSRDSENISYNAFTNVAEAQEINLLK